MIGQPTLGDDGFVPSLRHTAAVLSHSRKEVAFEQSYPAEVRGRHPRGQQAGPCSHQSTRDCLVKILLPEVVHQHQIIDDGVIASIKQCAAVACSGKTDEHGAEVASHRSGLASLKVQVLKSCVA